MVCMSSSSQTRARILVVEDEERIREGLADVLAFRGYAPTAVVSGEQGLELALGEPFDLVILDVMLPGLSGFDVCRAVRARHEALPIMMLTAKGAEDDVVQGFACGADDYVTKPFSIRELMARVEALLRRARPRARQARFRFGPWDVDAQNLSATDGRRSIDLSRREAELLGLLERESGRIVSRRALLTEVWGMRHVAEIETRTVDMHVAKLRKKIDGDGRSLIETIRGSCYRYRPEAP